MYQVILEKVGAVSAALARCGPKGPGPVGRPLGRMWGGGGDGGGIDEG